MPGRCSRFGTAASVCDPDFKQWIVGSRTAWNITPDLEVSGDILYQRFDTASSGVIPLPTARWSPASPAAAYEIKDQGQFMFISRLIRSW